MTKVYDCFPFAGEIDILILRLNTHNPVVDYFVIVESNLSHAGHPRKLCFDPHDPRLLPFVKKIRYVLVTDFPGNDPWQNEHWQRNAIVRALWDAKPNDLILISDCDEIIRPKCITSAKHQQGADLFGFQQPIYFCYMNNINVEGSPNQIWGVAVRYRKLQERTATDYRLMIRGLGLQNIWWYKDAGWHYSYMMTTERIAEKIRNFAHQEYNNDEVLSNLNPEMRARAGEDLLGRAWMRWKLLSPSEVDTPDYVRTNMPQYQKFFLEP